METQTIPQLLAAVEEGMRAREAELDMARQEIDALRKALESNNAAAALQTAKAPLHPCSGCAQLQGEFLPLKFIHKAALNPLPLPLPLTHSFLHTRTHAHTRACVKLKWPGCSWL